MTHSLHSLDRTHDPVLNNLLDEITRQLQAGLQVDLAAIAAEHPEYEEPLQRLLPSIKLLARLGSSSLESITGLDPPRAGQELPDGLLGDFRILGEIGRGGMGVIYEAEQLSLGRRVALKILPFASMLDPRALQRFQNEARAAALIDHPHIVDIYGVGCERGVHYYAMRLIDGPTLSDVISQLRAAEVGGASAPFTRDPQGSEDAQPSSAPTFVHALDPTQRSVSALAAFVARSTLPPFKSRDYYRAAAQLGMAVAEALDHAHQQGVIHRDIKPSNLIFDSRGKIWVTDLGLAHIESAGQSMTRTGDLLGTLRYMSPEQALAQRAVVDHRSDIYSLGATLYELLTLQPVFDGQDRNELLRQLSFDEPRPLRQSNKSIPIELETIVLKSLEKSPADRYATAKELADDLRRYVMDEPIRARPPSIVHKARKWSRRNRAIVATGTVGLTLALTVLIGSIGWALRDQAVRQTITERLVIEALRDARPHQDRADWPQALAAVERAESLIKTGPASEALNQQVRELLRDLQMALRLEEIRLEMSAVKAEKYDYARAGTDYAEAFREYGIDVLMLTPGDAGSRIRNRTIRV